MIYTVKEFGIVNKAVDDFMDVSCFFSDPVDVGDLISGSSAFSKSSLNIWKFMVHISLKIGLENFEHYFTSMWDECNCAVVWAFFGITFLWDWNENWLFPVLWPLLSFPVCWHIEYSTFTASSVPEELWMDSRHCTRDRDQDHRQEQEMQKGKMVVWGGLTNSCEKKRSKRQRRKGKIYSFECRVLKNSKER